MKTKKNIEVNGLTRGRPPCLPLRHSVWGLRVRGPFELACHATAWIPYATRFALDDEWQISPDDLTRLNVRCSAALAHLFNAGYWLCKMTRRVTCAFSLLHRWYACSAYQASFSSLGLLARERLSDFHHLSGWRRYSPTTRFCRITDAPILVPRLREAIFPGWHLFQEPKAWLAPGSVGLPPTVTCWRSSSVCDIAPCDALPAAVARFGANSLGQQ